MRIWIDADAAPREVREIVFRAVRRLGLEAILVANHRLRPPPGNPHVRSVLVAGGPDVADRYIAEHADPEDLVVTADIPLAAILVERGIVAIDPRGDLYTAATVGERLSIRNFMEGLRDEGIRTGGPSSFGEREKRSFANALDRLLSARTAREPRSGGRKEEPGDPPP